MSASPTKPDFTYGAAVESIAAAAGSCPEAVALGMTSILGAVAGEFAGINTDVGDVIRPRLNLIVAGADDPRWQRTQQLLLGPVESAQRRVREMSRAVSVERLSAIEKQHAHQDATNHIIKDEEGNRFDADGSIWAGMEQRKIEALRQPSFILRSPSPKALHAGIVEVLDRAPLLAFPDGDLMAQLIRRRRGQDVTEYLHRIVDSVSGCDEFFAGKSGLGHIEAVRAKLFATCTRRHLEQALQSDDDLVSRLLHTCIVVDVENSSPGAGDENSVRTGFQQYREAVKKVLLARRSGQGMRFSLSAPAAAHLRRMGNELSAWVQKLPGPLRPHYRNVLTLPHSVFWTLLATNPGMYRRDEALCLGAIRIVVWTIRRQRQLLESLLQSAALSERDRSRERMLAKLRERPCTFRDLLRRYASQRKEDHEPVLMELVNEGRIRLGDDGLLRIAEEQTDVAVAG
jgi:hypothetical protein